MNASGDIYVADYGNSRVEEFAPPPAPRGSVSPIWYFAEGHVGDGFQEYLSIQNPDPYNVCAVQIEYDRGQGTPITRTVSSCAGVVAERPMYFQNVFGISSGTDALGATRLNTRHDCADVLWRAGSSGDYVQRARGD